MNDNAIESEAMKKIIRGLMDQVNELKFYNANLKKKGGELYDLSLNPHPTQWANNAARQITAGFEGKFDLASFKVLQAQTAEIIMMYATPILEKKDNEIVELKKRK